MELGRRECNNRGEKKYIMFLVTDNEGRTICHVASKEGTLDIFLELLVWRVTKRRKTVNN